MSLINNDNAELMNYSLHSGNAVLQTPHQTQRNVKQRTHSQTRAALTRLTQILASASARQCLNHLLNLIFPLLGHDKQRTIHEDKSNDESVLSTMTDAELDESEANSSTRSVFFLTLPLDEFFLVRSTFANIVLKASL